MDQQNKRSRLIYALIAVVSLCFMVLCAENAGLWYDEFAQICFSGLDQTVWDSMTTTDPTPPLFNVLANIWYDLVPYGERWLLLLPQLAMVCGVYVCGLWGELLGGRAVGIWSALLIGCSQMVIEQCGFEFRGYGFYLLFAALALYLHSRLLMAGDSARAGLYAAFFGALVGLLYSHTFGMLMFAGLGGIDLILILTGKAPKKRLAAYVAAGVLFLPWAIHFLISAGQLTSQTEVAWMTAPTFVDVFKLVVYMCGNHIVVCGLFALGTVCVALDGWKTLRKKGWEPEMIGKLIPYAVSAFVILVAFLYGILRAEYASLWVKRYFTGLFPCGAVVCALGAVWLEERLGCVTGKKQLQRAGMLVVALSIFPVFLIKTAAGDTPLGKYYNREVTQVLYEQPDIREDRVMVLSTFDQYIEGWEEYYCSRKGAREGLGIRSIFDVATEELLENDVVYFEYNFWEERSAQCEARLLLEAEYVPTQTWEDIKLIRYEKQ